MNVDVLGRTLIRPADQSRLAIADCDIHPRVRGYKDVYPWLAKRWQEHLEVFGAAHRQPMEKGPAFPKAQPMARANGSQASHHRAPLPRAVTTTPMPSTGSPKRPKFR